MDSDQITELLALTPVIAGTVQVLKTAGLPRRYAGVAALILGVLIAVALDGPTIVPILAGVVLGLAAQGLYETVTLTRKPAP